VDRGGVCNNIIYFVFFISFSGRMIRAIVRETATRGAKGVLARTRVGGVRAAGIAPSSRVLWSAASAGTTAVA